MFRHFFENNKGREQLFTGVLFSALFFFMVVADLSNSLKNAQYIYSLQLFFCFVYILSLKDSRFIKFLLKKNKLETGLILAWFVSVLLAFFYSSPFGGEFGLSVTRLLQTYMYVFFFLLCWHLFLTRAVNIKWVFYVIIMTGLIVIGAYFFKAYLYPFMSSVQWMNEPPLNSHFRHTGYQVVASLCLLLALLMEQKRHKSESWVQFMMLVALLAFLFWLGGRGSIISVYMTVCFYFGVLLYKQGEAFKFLFVVLVASIMAVFLSEYFALFSWNGLSGALMRSESAETMNSLSSGRLDIWLSTWNVYKEHVFLGLGPQGFFNIPLEGSQAIQPHNVFLQFLVEWGLVGTVIFMVLLIKGFYFGIRQHVLTASGGVNVYTLGAGGVIVALSIHGLFDGTYYHPQPSVYLAFAFALWLQVANFKN